MNPENQTSAPKNKLNISLDYRIITVFLLLVIVTLVLLWRPWVSNPTAKDRVITVSGEAKITASPDEYVFYPSYEFKNASKDAALAELNAKSADVVAQLKKLGVADNKIKTDSSGYDYQTYSQTNSEVTYTLSFTVTVGDKTKAQKVQDYLITTAPTGSVSPQADFSDAKQKSLQTQARDEATKDARAKADQSAKNLGFKVGAVKSVSDGQDSGIRPYVTSGIAQATDSASSKSSLSLQPGENDLNYSVEVTFYIH